MFMNHSSFVLSMKKAPTAVSAFLERSFSFHLIIGGILIK
nr:MAG TPA: hypothetical protein [Caudoviricetes sp.]